jgi:Fe-S-cluster containining protein
MDLPAMPESNGCGDCCGPVTARPKEMKAIQRYARKHRVVWEEHEDLSCGFLRSDGPATYSCAIYPVRPWGCHAFGVVNEMSCPHFPEAARVSYPAERVVRERIMLLSDELLGEAFEADYVARLERVFKREMEAGRGGGLNHNAVGYIRLDLPGRVR